MAVAVAGGHVAVAAVGGHVAVSVSVRVSVSRVSPCLRVSCVSVSHVSRVSCVSVSVSGHGHGHGHGHVYVYVYVCGGGSGGGGQSQEKLKWRLQEILTRKSQPSHGWFFHCFSKRAGGEQLYQMEQRIGGIGNMLFSIFSQT